MNIRRARACFITLRSNDMAAILLTFSIFLYGNHFVFYPLKRHYGRADKNVSLTFGPIKINCRRGPHRQNEKCLIRFIFIDTLRLKFMEWWNVEVEHVILIYNRHDFNILFRYHRLQRNNNMESFDCRRHSDKSKDTMINFLVGQLTVVDTRKQQWKKQTSAVSMKTSARAIDNLCTQLVITFIL